jgi:hypothetical protein
MKVTIEDIQKAINKMAEFQFNLNKIKKIADDEKMSVEELFIGDVPYNEFVKEGFIYCDELDTLLEAAKESIIDNLDKNKISLLKKFERFDGDLAQEYYISEKYANLPFIVNRAKKIKPLYTEERVPAFIKKKYKEAILCFLDGRFDSCCAMCRSITEILLKDLCQKKFGGKEDSEEKSLASLINICGNFKILKEAELISARRIKKTGNESMHSKTSKSEQEALTSIEDIQKIFKGVFVKRK